MKSLLTSFTIGLVAVPGLVLAQIIDFETVPGGIAEDKLLISTQYAAAYGVSFGYEGGNFPYLAKVGSPRTSFIGAGGGNDTPAANQGIGQFFLTDGNINITSANQNQVPPPLIITYSSPVANASGVILDLDDDFTPPNTGTEAWLFQAFDTSSNSITSFLLSTTNNNLAGNGLATPWSFKATTRAIKYIRITFQGTKTNGVGFAFDNFSPSLPVAAPQLNLSVTQGVAISIAGTIGSTNQIDYLSALGWSNWVTLTSLVLTQTPQSFLDYSATNSPSRFYRVRSTR